MNYVHSKHLIIIYFISDVTSFIAHFGHGPKKIRMKLLRESPRGGSWRCISYFSLDLSDIIPHFFEQWPVLRKTVHARFCARKHGYLFFENHKRQQKDNINGFGSQSNLLPQKPIFVVVLWKPSLLRCWIGNGMTHCLIVFEVMIISSSMAPFLACSGMKNFCSLGYV